MYRVIKKINDEYYEDFGCASTMENAERMRKAINIFLGYDIENIEIVEEKNE